MKTYEIKLQGLFNRLLSIHPRTAKKFGLSSRIILQYGTRSVEVNVKKTRKTKKGIMLLSEDVKEKLLIPITSRYEVIRIEEKMILGPYIAFYAGASEKRLLNRIKDLGKYTEHYHSINGTILAFSANGVDTERKTITGYIFDPENNEWIKGIYGYPMSILRNVSMDNHIHRELIRCVGKNIINETLVDKWKMHQWLSKSNELKNYLPPTILYKSPKDIFLFLKEYRSAYLKPINGFQGKGIMKVTKMRKDFKVAFKKKEKLVELVLTKNEAIRFFKKKLRAKKFILQKSLDIVHNGILLDFRAIVVKDALDEWKPMGLVGKSMTAYGITSNQATGGKEQLGVKALREVVGLSDVEAQKAALKMEEISVKIGEQLDMTDYHFGNLGIDIGIDRNGKLWIIEVNHRGPGHVSMKEIGFEEQFKQILKTNMLHAKSLAGF